MCFYHYKVGLPQQVNSGANLTTCLKCYAPGSVRFLEFWPHFKMIKAINSLVLLQKELNVPERWIHNATQRSIDARRRKKSSFQLPGVLNNYSKAVLDVAFLKGGLVHYKKES